MGANTIRDMIKELFFGAVLHTLSALPNLIMPSSLPNRSALRHPEFGNQQARSCGRQPPAATAQRGITRYTSFFTAVLSYGQAHTTYNATAEGRGGETLLVNSIATRIPDQCGPRQLWMAVGALRLGSLVPTPTQLGSEHLRPTGVYHWLPDTATSSRHQSAVSRGTQLRRLGMIGATSGQ